MSRFKNVTWIVKTAVGNRDHAADCHEASLAVLMDLRDELQEIKRALSPLRFLTCTNFQRIPAKLDRIGRNTVKKRIK